MTTNAITGAERKLTKIFCSDYTFIVPLTKDLMLGLLKRQRSCLMIYLASIKMTIRNRIS